MTEAKTRTVKLDETMTPLKELLADVSTGGRVVIRDEGGALAVLISPADFESLQTAEEQRADLFQALDGSWDAFKNLDPAEVEKAIDDTVAALRSKPSGRKKPSAAAGD